MPHFYEYTGDDQDLLVESDEPRPDLLEWAYFREISEDDARKRKPEAEPEKPAEEKPQQESPAAEPEQVGPPQPEPVEPEPVEPEPTPEPEPAKAPVAKKPPTRTPAKKAGQ